MYGLFERGADLRKRRVFPDECFERIEDAIDHFGMNVSHWEPDPENDAADLITAGGSLYMIERLPA